MLLLLSQVFITQGLRIKPQCPPMPTEYKEWDSKDKWFYGLIIDGKDASKGPHVYDWDHQLFPRVFKA